MIVFIFYFFIWQSTKVTLLGLMENMSRIQQWRTPYSLRIIYFFYIIQAIMPFANIVSVRFVYNPYMNTNRISKSIIRKISRYQFQGFWSDKYDYCMKFVNKYMQLHKELQLLN